MIALFTDFGDSDIYVGQVHAVLAEKAAGVRVVDLLHSAPAFDVRASAYLLFALQKTLPGGAVVMAVVDPGVGSDRAPIMVKADGKWFVGPDNGLLSRVMAAPHCRAKRILWRPNHMSASFHGRDLFAPVAAALALNQKPEHEEIEPAPGELADDLDQIIYVDHYGNAITGRSGESVSDQDILSISGREIGHARVFCKKAEGKLFWYVNSIGLVEIAANRASATRILGIGIGDAFNLSI